MLLTLAVLALAPAASAAPIQAFFDGPLIDGSRQGLADPTAALDAGLTLIDVDVFSPVGVLEPIAQSAEGMTIDEVESPAEITSQWTIQNLLSMPVAGEVWLLFSSVGNATREIGGQDVTTGYDPMEVALTVDEEWVVVQSEKNGTTVYYVGISLGSLLATPGATASVDVAYYLQNPETYPDGLDTILALPELEYTMAYQVPEPASGLLLGLGLLALAGRRRSV